MQDLSLTVTEVPCAGCGELIPVQHFAHARHTEFAPRYHLECAISEAQN